MANQIDPSIAARGGMPFGLPAGPASAPFVPPAPVGPASPFQRDVGAIGSSIGGLVGNIKAQIANSPEAVNIPSAAYNYFMGTPESLSAVLNAPNLGRSAPSASAQVTPASIAPAPAPQNVGHNVTVTGGGRSQNYSVPQSLGLTPEQHAGASNAIANAHLMPEEDFIAGLRGLPRFAVNQLVQRHLAFSPRDQALSEYLTMNRALADNAAATLPEGININDAKAVAKAQSAAINAARTNYLTNVERVAIPGMIPYTAGNVGIGPGGYPPQ